jgi:type VI secretion system protein ImpG
VDPLHEQGYGAFLTQLESLDSFFSARTRGSALQLQSEDPDVRRLLEAVAFFSARTQAAAAESMRNAIERMAGTTLEDLSALAPAAGLVELTPTAQFADPVQLPAGTLLRVSAPPPQRDGSVRRVSFFSTLAPVTLRRLAVRRAWVLPSGRAPHVAIELESEERQQEAFELALHVRRLGDYGASLTLFDTLRRLTRAVTVRADDADPLPATVTFGAEATERSALARVRSFLHFPEQALFLRVAVPRVPGGWRRLTIQLALEDGWPAELGVDANSFRLFVVPAHNLWTDFAAPLVYDGTADTLPLRIGAAREAAELVQLAGVYRVGAQLEPVMPLGLGLSRHGFELLPARQGGTPRLRVRLGEALQTPIKLTVEGRWSQPSLWQSPPSGVEVFFQQRAVAARLKLLGPVRRPAVSPLVQQPAQALEILARVGRRLERDDLVGLLEAAGACGDSPYAGLPARLDWLKVDDVPAPVLSSTSMIRRYRLGWRTVAPEQAPLLTELARCAERLLDAFSTVPVHVVGDEGVAEALHG